MTVHHGTSSRDGSRRGRPRADRPSRHAGSAVDGILVLIPPDPPRERSTTASDPVAHSAALVQLRTQHDAALEDIAFLEEQLRSTAAYHAHLLEQEIARMLAERTMLLRELVILGEELERRAHDVVSPVDGRPAGNGAIANGAAHAR